MKRLTIAGIVMAAGMGAYLWYGSRPDPSAAALHRQQQALVNLYQRLPSAERTKVEAFLSRRMPDWRRQLDEFQASPKAQFSQAMLLSMQVAVQPQLKPVPIVNGKLAPVLPQPNIPQALPLTPERQEFILRYARSVGRLEVKTGASYALKGTGFVIAPGLIATNCHVVREVAQPPSAPGTAFTLAAGDLRVDFGDTPVHDESREFKILDLKPCPGEGLDVAFLQAEPRSISGTEALPGPLQLTASIPAALAARKELYVGQIGFPDLNDPNLVGGTPTQDLFKNFDSTKYAKFYTPGAITSVRPKSGIDFLYHIVSTWPGESGSPLLDVDGRSVVAVDSCCDRANGSLPSPADLKCATRLLTSPANLAISGWSVLKDPVLGVMLPATPATLGAAAGKSIPKM